MAALGSVRACTTCWCANVTIDRDALARVPGVARDRACLCRRCATGEADPAAALAKDPGGREAVVLRGSGGTAMVALDGAQVLSWRPDHAGDDVLWSGSRAEFAPQKPVRGGVPLVFPWFGDHPDDRQKPAHGFARNLTWRLAECGPGPLATLALADDAATRALWPHRFALRFTVSTARGLELTLAIANTGKEPMRCEAAFHTYFAVGDVHRAVVHGLAGVPFVETASAPESPPPDQGSPLHFRAETDRVFQGVPDKLRIAVPALARSISLATRGADSAIVWNPWPAKCARLSQLAADDWTKFVCVETACVRERAIQLAPGAEHTMSLRLEVTNLEPSD